VKRQTMVEVLAFLTLVLTCAAVRIALQDLPNFAPVAAVALFAGYFFRSAAFAVAVPLTAMAVSDAFIGGYDWRMMLTVYAMLALPVAARGPLRRHLAFTDKATWKPVFGLLSCSLAASVAFFAVTNFACWAWFSLYEHTWTGLLTCYAQALPFFRATLAGDMFFAVVLFGSYGLVTSLVTASRPALQTE